LIELKVDSSPPPHYLPP